MEVRVEGEEQVNKVALGIKDRHGWAAARAGPGKDLGNAVAVDVAGRYADAAGEEAAVVRREHEELIDDRMGLAIDGPNRRIAARTGADDDVGEAVAGQIAGRDRDAAGETAQGVEVFEQHRGVIHAGEDLEVVVAAGGAADDVEHAVVVDVAPGHGNAAGEAGESGELVLQVAGLIKDADDAVGHADAGVGKTGADGDEVGQRLSDDNGDAVLVVVRVVIDRAGTGYVGRVDLDSRRGGSGVNRDCYAIARSKGGNREGIARVRRAGRRRRERDEA